MNKLRVVCGVLVVVLVAAAIGHAVAENWPQWRGPNRDGSAPAFKAPADWPKTLVQKWKQNVGLGDAGPVLANGMIFVFARQGNDEVTLCLNAETQKEQWRDKYPAPEIKGADRGHSGPRAAPVLAEGRLVTFGVAGVLSCFDADKGALLWRVDRYKAVPRFHTSCSPLIADKLVVVQVGSEKEGAVVALDLADGKEKWSWAGDGQQYSSPVLMTADGVKQVVAMTANKVVGIGLADGKLLWEVPFVAKGRDYNAATPIVDGSTVIFTGASRGTAAVRIEKKDDSFAATPVWKNDEIGTQFCTPVLANGLLFGVSDKGKLFCLSAKDGKAAWTQETKLGGYAAMIAADGVVMALPSNGELIVFKAADKYAELAKYKVAESTVYAYPAVVNNRIYVKDQDNLTLWVVE